MSAQTRFLIFVLVVISVSPLVAGVVADVRHFGARCDGATDDAAAFSLAASLGGDIAIPAGVCLLGSTVTVGVSGTRLIGERGATLREAGGANLDHLFIVSGAGVEFRGLDIDGNGANQTAGLGRGLLIVAADFRLEDSTVRGFGWSLTGTQAFGVFGYDAPRMVISGNSFYGNINADVRADESAYADKARPYGGDDSAAATSDSPQIIGNRFGVAEWAYWTTANRKNFAYESVSLINVRGAVVSRNIFAAGPIRTNGEAGRGGAIRCLGCEQAVVSANAITGLANGAGTLAVTQGSATVDGSGTEFSTAAYTLGDVGTLLAVEGDGAFYRVTAVASATSITVSPAIARATGSGLRYKLTTSADQVIMTGDRNVIANNTCRYSHDNCFSFGDDGTAGESFNYNTISGNVGTMAFTSGLVIDAAAGESRGNVASGNVFCENGQGGAAAGGDAFRAGVHLVGSGTEDNAIAGNMLCDFQASGTQLYGVSGVHAANFIGVNLFSGNVMGDLE